MLIDSMTIYRTLEDNGEAYSEPEFETIQGSLRELVPENAISLVLKSNSYIETMFTIFRFGEGFAGEYSLNMGAEEVKYFIHDREQPGDLIKGAQFKFPKCLIVDIDTITSALEVFCEKGIMTGRHQWYRPSKEELGIYY